ncbi:hypothetical protein EYF80_019099 [Liparis tanakae]|uniref:Uncharacterized protein n=1 Tax=Liparis tanakae TaxID=230148 RepID=A0A4Z2I0A7_9TELE|nr:hypothetical protein EYF80_019099 [Liparis tanakae]
MQEHLLAVISWRDTWEREETKTKGALDETALGVPFLAELKLQDRLLFCHQVQNLRWGGQQQLGVRGVNILVADWALGPALLTNRQKQLLVEGLVLVAPFVSAAPTGLASISEATSTSTGFKGEVQQVVEAYFFRSSKLSRAKLGPACLCYLEKQKDVSSLPTREPDAAESRPVVPVCAGHRFLHCRRHSSVIQMKQAAPVFDVDFAQ